MATDLASRTDHLDSLIDHFKQTLMLLSDSHPSRPILLAKLGVTYADRFNYLGELIDLDMSRDYLSEASSLTPDEHPEKPLRLNDLGICYCFRFERLGKIEDLNLSMSCSTQALSLAADDHPDRLNWINTLGVSHRVRFQHLGEVEDLDKSLDCLAHVTSLTPDEDPNKPKYLMNQGASHGIRFSRLGELKDLEMSISCLEQATSLMPDDFSDTRLVLNNLSVSYHRRFRRLGDLNDLEKALHCSNQAVSLTPDSHVEQPGQLDNLVEIHVNWYHRLGKLENLNLAISLSDRALSLVPNEHPQRPTLLCNSGEAHQYLYRHQGELANLDKAISYLNQAHLLTPTGHQTERPALNHLAIAYMNRFDHLGELADLDSAITYANEAVLLTSDGDPSKSGHLATLGGCYQSRFKRLKNLSDLEIALDKFIHAASLLPDDQEEKTMPLNRIAQSYIWRFQYLGQPDDLDKAHACITQALSLLPEGHSDKKIVLSTLSRVYHQRYICSRELADLNKGIAALEEAISITPDEYPTKGSLFEILGACYQWRFNRCRSPTDIRASIVSFKRAVHSTANLPRCRLAAAHLWAKVAMVYDLMDSSLEGYQQIMILVPQVVWLGATVHQRYKQVSQVDNLAIEAAAAAIRLRKFDTALEWLEQGRTIIWGQLLQLRTPLDELSTADPSLAQELRQITQDLECTFTAISSAPSTLSSDPFSAEQISQRHRRLVEKRERLIAQARTLPGLHGFLQPTKASLLVAAARSGALVVVEVHESGCHALAVRPQAADVTCIPLPAMTQQSLVAARDGFTRLAGIQGRTSRQIVYMPEEEYSIEATLKMLWSDLVEPVLDTLGYMEPSTCRGSLPHITWCLTGALSFLPVHAAGDYAKPGCSLFDYAISSFTPSVSALLAPPARPEEFSGILAIGQAHTPGLTPLPGTLTELDNISAQVDATYLTRLEGERATTEATLATLDSRSWVHFACHAIQNIASPTESAFHLHDGSLDLATITRKQLKHADLAFLSACQTATGDTNLPEEAVHLAAGMIMAGYRRVIATLWSINDEDAPLVAEKFYAYMLDKDVPNEGKTAKALHYAVECLRDKVGVRSFERWAPYIHIGQ